MIRCGLSVLLLALLWLDPSTADCPKPVVFNTDDTAVLLIDYQANTIDFGNTTGTATVVTQAVVRLARAAIALNMSLIIVTFSESDLGAVIPELAQAAPTQYANRIMRSGILNSWNDPYVVKAVAATRKRNLILAGLTTEIGAVAPAIAARAAGYNVKMVADVGGSETTVAEQVAWQRLQNGGVEVTTLGAMFAELVKDGNSPAGIVFTF